ncbi:MAG: hypothetical protein ACI9MX_001614 [Candidatus Aldehydirespiratoraceae bacterium]|jgi:hypothetical protein
MKKLFAVLFAFLLFAAACGDDSSTDNQDPTTDSVPAADDDMTDDDMTDDDMTDDEG